ncbi:hypothetical protein PROFUN_04743 [Planoprotostelium fungivorum]|uniref:Uncharacterized protein n=1 Tax=Planoprotostelium fungivorum TaxID=1890364 RepID=A0A2P6NFZ8_9EUKA|nr:hypothetical protein PROFUN_04743 [Planoprotostelium fungivorum]
MRFCDERRGISILIKSVAESVNGLQWNTFLEFLSIIYRLSGERSQRSMDPNSDDMVTEALFIRCKKRPAAEPEEADLLIPSSERDTEQTLKHFKHEHDNRPPILRHTTRNSRYVLFRYQGCETLYNCRVLCKEPWGTYVESLEDSRNEDGELVHTGTRILCRWNAVVNSIAVPILEVLHLS